jgi:hypothetical protein
MRKNVALALSAAAGLGLIAFTGLAVETRPKADFGKASDEMAKAATAFLNALSPDQQAKAKFDLKDAERLNWHFIPKERKGLTIKEMKPEQRHLAQALLATGLSQKGYEKATIIMSLEQILADMEGPNRRFPRDPELYHVSVFGTPDPKGAWAWRVEGHHLSLNFTLAGGKAIAATPSFFGSNPGQVKEGPRKGLRVLGNDEDMARKLVQSLSGEQKAAAVVADKAPADILLTPEGVKKQGAKPFDPAGISFSKLNDAQRAQLKALVKEYAHRHRAELEEQDLAKIEQAGWDKVSFAWAGGLEPGQGHYYRVQGPTFVLEYDNTQNNANHVHSVWHDPESNFGADILKKHYEQDHK